MTWFNLNRVAPDRTDVTASMRKLQDAVDQRALAMRMTETDNGMHIEISRRDTMLYKVAATRPADAIEKAFRYAISVPHSSPSRTC